MSQEKHVRLIYEKPGIRISLIDGDTVYTECSVVEELYDHDYYQNGYLRFRDQREALFSEIIDKASLRGATPEKSWLDCGSGCGIFLNVLEKRGYNRLWGVEPSRDACNIASSITHAVIINRDPLEMSAEEIPPVDVVSFLDVIAHVPDPEKTLRRCFERLNENGLCILKTPHRDPGYVEFCLRHFKNSPEFVASLLHAGYQKYSWSFGGITKLLRQVGFTEVECIPFHEFKEPDYRFEITELWHPRRLLYRAALRKSQKIQTCSSILIFARKKNCVFGTLKRRSK